MNQHGCRIRQKAPRADAGAGLSASAQFVPFLSQGPLTPMFSKMMLLRKVTGEFYETMREKIPIFDAAINRLVSLNGTVKIIGDNDKLVSELEDIALNIPVNDHQKGLNAYQANLSNEAFEQGFAYGEMVATPDLKDIAELRVADSKFIVFRLNGQGRTEPWYRYLDANAALQRFPSSRLVGNNIMQALNRPTVSPFSGQSLMVGGWQEQPLNAANKMYLSFNNENTDPGGVSIMRSTEFCAGVLATIQTSFQHVFRRWGDPAYHVDYKTTKKNLGGTELEKRRAELETKFAAIARAKSMGYSADLVTAHDPDSEVKIVVIGADGKIIPAQIPLQHLLEQIVSKTGLPAWMLGIYWSTTTGMANLEVENVLQDTKIRQFAMLPEYIRMCSTILTLRGRNWKRVNISMDENKPGDWGIKFETPNLRDVVAQANARFLNAEADHLLMQVNSGTAPPVEIGGPKPKPGKVSNVGAAPCGCPDCGGEKGGHTGPPLHGEDAKELHRPTPWPELDQVETDYENALKARWDELAQKCLAILKLGPMPKGVDGETFTFSAEERARIMDEMKEFIGEFEITDGSPLRWYYGQSYSMGLIQAARLVGKERPILDIIKNREIYDELVKNGFELLKDNATRAITARIIPEMQAHVLAGSNPLAVAERLKRLFGDKNSDWERLARTEMSTAAEQAKLDEWREWKVKKVEFVPAPDACGICKALKGEYEIKKCPVAGRDTHPRCRCSTRPAAEET